MNNEIQLNKSFEEKMKDRIKDSIGDLITDEELTKLVNRGVEEVFFSPTKIRVNSWDTKDGPSLLHGIIKEVLKPEVTKAVNVWINEHPDDMREILKTVVRDGVGEAVVNAVSSIFSQQLMNFQTSVESQLISR